MTFFRGSVINDVPSKKKIIDDVVVVFVYLRKSNKNSPLFFTLNYKNIEENITMCFKLCILLFYSFSK